MEELSCFLPNFCLYYSESDSQPFQYSKLKEEKVLQKHLWMWLGRGCITKAHTRSRHPSLAPVVFDFHLGGDQGLQRPGPVSAEATVLFGSGPGVWLCHRKCFNVTRRESARRVASPVKSSHSPVSSLARGFCRSVTETPPRSPGKCLPKLAIQCLAGTAESL